MQDDYVFKYNDNHTYTSNFLRWRARNNEEKMMYGEQEYSLLEAKEVFDKMYQHKKEEENKDSWREGTIWSKK